MTRIVRVSDIIPLINTPEYSTAFDVTIDNTAVLTTNDFIAELEYNFYNMSFISHQPKEYDLTAFIMHWGLYKKRYTDEWATIYRDVALTKAQTFNPMTDYGETKTVTPDITVESTTEYGRITDTTDDLEHGLTNTLQTNTYEGSLRDSGKSTNSGTDSRTANTTDSGSDTNTTTTTGDTTETKEGYRNNPLVNLQTDIDFTFKNNLRDLIINNFAREVLFYNNDNEEGCIYGIYY